ncbi:RHS repeat-associated core domain-containing protein [Neorhizobium sp. P12A]|uniref:RHS repeat domain-containing protein n=1 Tax=Neorhizobium sp. P12A TaxID=2268027 RepID=UPI001AED2B49|nr:RHS repeat-associated core domain-containing protein [Neorhizobium sp. P12A]
MSALKIGVLGVFILGMISTAVGATSVPNTPIADMSNAIGFAEPLVATKTTTVIENNTLSTALDAFEHRKNPSDLTSLTNYLDNYPDSGWSSALWTNIGLSYLHDGYFSRALDAWQNAWLEGRGASSPEGRAVVDRAIGELAGLDASLGKTNELTAVFASLGDRKVSGPATEKIQTARETLALANNAEAHLFNCGPLALRALMLSLNAKPNSLDFLQYYSPGPDGTTLSEVAGLADRLKLNYRLIKRSPGQDVPVPSIVHWKVGHFAAITGKQNGRYHVQDAVFPNADIWVTDDALDAEASGYFLVPANQIADARWLTVSASEGATVRGKGTTNSTRLGGAGDPSVGGDGGQDCPLCSVSIKDSSVSVAISDTPVGYVPPIGPSMKIGISYNQREDSQPANFSYFNVSQKWSMNWSSYIIDDPTNPGANVSRTMGTGGAFYYLGYNPVQRTFAAQDTDGSILSLVSQSPVSYRRQTRNGSLEVYEQSDGSTAFPRRIFLTKVIDPQGNAATLHYDGQRRLTSITDAVGRDTTFSYDVPGRPLLISKITDPFGRSASLGYDAQGRLASITDVIGLTSSFSYDANSLINSLTTPYGTTHFSYSAPGTSAPPRFVQITDPMGSKERVEWLEPAPIPDSDPAATVPTGMPIGLTNGWLRYRNSFFWDKSACVTAGCTDTGGCDYTKARLRHFVHMPNSTIKGTAVESEKDPLENRVWYVYPGQTSGSAQYGGTYDRPIGIGRVLDDGTSQVRTFAYDTNGNLTQATDPSGRITYYSYTNGIDVAAVSQASQFGSRTTVDQFIYNGQHRPIFHSDAAGRTSTMEYNAAGQRTTLTDALGEKTNYQYDPSANLASIVNANDATAASYTYDGFARVRTYTDSEGRTVSYDYDAANRPTKITYPDGTSQRYTYDRLDLISYEDREARRWQYQYDADRRVVGIVDPAGQKTTLGYDPAGHLVSLTDPKGNVTSWTYDVQGRRTSKTYADGKVYTYTYENTTSRLKSTLDALNQTKQYSYAVDDSVTGLAYLNAVNPTPSVSFTYDPYFSRVTSMTDGTGTTSYTYNPSFVDGALQRNSECFSPPGSATCAHEIDYAYDALSRLATRTIQGSGPETFQYDAIGRVIAHSSDLGGFQTSYLGQTRQPTARQLLPISSNLKTTWSYLDNTNDRRLSGIGIAGLSSSQFTNFTIDTSPNNFVTGITQASDQNVPEPSPSAQTVSFNNLNQISQLSGQSYNYDANGNLLSDGSRNYSWDAEDRLIGISYPGQPGKKTEFSYNGLNQRVMISHTPAGGGSSVPTSYVWCGSEPCQSRDASNAVIRDYFSEGELVPGLAAQPYYYGRDQIGSVRRVFASAASAPAYDYDAYGTALQASPPVASFGYAGMFYEPDSGLYLTQFRAYDPVAGRWLSRDPAGEVGDPSNNLYAYVGGNPLGIIDPLGLCGGPFDDLLNALASSPLLLPAIIGTEIVGGGPENPIADAAVIAEIEAAEATAAADVVVTEAAEGAESIGAFSPINPGPLASDVADTFRSGTYEGRVLTEDTTLYRVIGDGGNPAGRYWTETEPAGPLQSVIDSALDQSWGNTATTTITRTFPAGTQIYSGAAAAQGGLVGGGSQIYIPGVVP